MVPHQCERQIERVNPGRARAAEVTRRVKPWLKSTGPRTGGGRAADRRGTPGRHRQTAGAVGDAVAIKCAGPHWPGPIGPHLRTPMLIIMAFAGAKWAAAGLRGRDPAGGDGN